MPPMRQPVHQARLYHAPLTHTLPTVNTAIAIVHGKRDPIIIMIKRASEPNKNEPEKRKRSSELGGYGTGRTGPGEVD